MILNGGKSIPGIEERLISFITDAEGFSGFSFVVINSLGFTFNSSAKIFKV